MFYCWMRVVDIGVTRRFLWQWEWWGSWQDKKESNVVAASQLRQFCWCKNMRDWKEFTAKTKIYINALEVHGMYWNRRKTQITALTRTQTYWLWRAIQAGCKGVHRDEERNVIFPDQIWRENGKIKSDFCTPPFFSIILWLFLFSNGQINWFPSNWVQLAIKEHLHAQNDSFVLVTVSCQQVLPYCLLF